MSLWLCIVLFIIGVVLVVKGGDFFVDAAAWIARASGVPAFIVGATIVSVATTLPEMIVSLMAASEGSVDMAVGNAVGSVTANTGLILAVGMLFMHIACPRKDYLIKGVLLTGGAAILLLACLKGELQTWGSVMLILIFAIFVYENITGARREMQTSQRPKVTKKDLTVNLIKFVLGAAGIVAGSRLLVSSGTQLADYMGVPERIVAVTLVAIGTSLPELVTTITAIVKKESGLSIGNIIGANIIDLTLILPLCSLVSGSRLPVSASSVMYDIPACLITVLLALVPLLLRQKSSRVQGAVLLASYAAYLIIIL